MKFAPKVREKEGKHVKVGLPGNSLWSFWDGENVTLSMANRDLQIWDKKITAWITWYLFFSLTFFNLGHWQSEGKSIYWRYPNRIDKLQGPKHPQSTKACFGCFVFHLKSCWTLTNRIKYIMNRSLVTNNHLPIHEATFRDPKRCLQSCSKNQKAIHKMPSLLTTPTSPNQPIIGKNRPSKRGPSFHGAESMFLRRPWQNAKKTYVVISGANSSGQATVYKKHIIALCQP